MRGTCDDRREFAVSRLCECQHLDAVVGKLLEVLQHCGDGGEAGDLGEGEAGLGDAAGVGGVQDLRRETTKELLYHDSMRHIKIDLSV